MKLLTLLPYSAVVVTTSALLGTAVYAAPIAIDLDTGLSTINNVNAGNMSTRAQSPSDYDGDGFLAQVVGGATANGAARINTYIMTGVSGGTYDGLVFSFDVEQFGYTTAGSGATLVNVRSSEHIGVDQPGGGEDRNQIDSAALLGGSVGEFLRLIITNLSVDADPNNTLGGNPLQIDGFTSITSRHQNQNDDGADTGTIYAAGTTDVGTTALGSYVSTTEFRDFITFSATNGVDVVPTGDKTTLQGFSAQFSVVPEPGSLALLGLAGLCLMRRRRG